MPKRKSKDSNLKEIEKLFSQQLDEQTAEILNAVDQKISKLEREIEKFELRISQKIDRLVTTLDKFLKRLTDLETDFEMMKLDLNRVKKVIKEKLGVDLF